MCPSNYKDFYQKALVPNADDPIMHSHWLIALEGELKEPGIEYYIWRVTIYPSDSNGSFSWNTLYYSSPVYDCIHSAYNHANDLEKSGKNDQLHFSRLRESIG